MADLMLRNGRSLRERRRGGRGRRRARVYGDAKYDRFVALKRAWDPDNAFRLNQNIRA
jgi:hypothetical protein